MNFLGYDESFNVTSTFVRNIDIEHLNESSTSITYVVDKFGADEMLRSGLKIQYDPDTESVNVVGEYDVGDVGDVVSTVSGLKVSTMDFKLRFTAEERIAIYARSDEPMVADFIRLIDDPRLVEIDLTSNDVVTALAYMENLNLLASGRKSEILGVGA